MMIRKHWSRLSNLIVLAAILFGFAGRPTLASPSLPGASEIVTQSQGGKGDDPFDDPRTREVLLAGAVAPLPAGGPDQFGYVWEDVAYPGLTALSSPTVVSFPVAPGEPADDMSSSPIEIGFSFPFYERSYSQLYASTNGYLTFEKPFQDVLRNPLPHPAAPNSFISAFTDDLVVGGGSSPGRMLYQTLGTAPYRKFIVRWERVTRLGFSDELTFDVVLSETSGNIQLLYHTLSGELTQATVGIEDPDGLDGLLYLQYKAGLASGKAVQFTRPPNGPRVKMLAAYRSSFAIQNKAAIPIKIRNTGSASDTFNLSSSLVEPVGATNWKVGFYPETGTTPLADTNSDGKRDTGPLASGKDITVRALVECTSACAEGVYVEYQVRATSIQLASKSAMAKVQVAVPASFAEAFVDIDSNYGVGLDLIWKERRITSRATDWFSGSNLALAPLANRDFIFLWERNDRSTNVHYLPFTDLEYAFVTNTGSVPRTRVKLTSNLSSANETLSVADRFPAATSLDSGHVGVAWMREKSDETGGDLKINSNVYFAVLGVDGNLATPLTPVTDNQEWGSFGNERFYQSISITRISDANFLISWADSDNLNNEWSSDIAIAVYNQDAGQVKAPTTLTSSIRGQTLYRSPILAPLTGGRTLLVYTIENADLTSDLAFMVLDSSGNVQQAQTLVANAHGTDPDAVQLINGQVLIAWSQAASSGIGYVLYNSALNAVLAGPGEVSSPDDRIGGHVSVTYDSLGHGLLTWVDQQWTNYLYYTLISGSGKVLTPPMVFYPVGRETSYVISSDISQGSAPYEGRSFIFLPAMRK